MAELQPPGNGEAVQHHTLLAAHEAAANKCWRQTVSLLRPLAEAGNVDAVKLLARALSAAGRPAEASEHLRTAITTASPETAGGLQLLKLLGDCLVQSGQWQQAASAYQVALAAFREQQQRQDPSAVQQEDSARHEGHQPLEPPTAQQPHLQNDLTPEPRQSHTMGLVLQACCAAAWYPQGGPQAEAAVHVLHSILRHPQGAKLPGALRLYAQVAADQQQWTAVAQLTVRLLAVEPHDEQGARLLAAAAQDSSGLQSIQSAAAADATASPAASAAALAYLASRLLSQGAVPQAVQLHRSAVQLNPESSWCALGLAQALEVQFDYAGVLQALLGFCESNTQLVLGSSSLQAVLGMPGLRVLAQQPLPPGSLQWYHSVPGREPPAVPRAAQACSRHQQLQHQHREGPQQMEPSHTAEVTGQDWGNDCCAQLITPPAGMSPGGAQEQQQQQVAPAGSQLVSGQGPLQAPQTSGRVAQYEGPSCERSQQCLQPQPPVLLQVSTLLPPPPLLLQQQQQQAAPVAATQPQVMCVDDSSVDLNTLALLFTAAKALFCGGALTTALELLWLCEGLQLEAAAAQPLHQTSIRNEAAYAALMRQLLEQALPSILAAPIQLEVLWVVGDSHVLPLAWRTVTLGAKPHLMVPLLLTGCKAWHLRPGSTHPCRYQLSETVGAVPAGGRVLLVLGELDCREGLLMAVEKLKYNSLQEAVSTTVGHYVAAILSLVRVHGWQVWVHPAPPVLTETHPIVSEFNTELRQQLELQAEQHGKLADKLRYVDVEAALLQHRAALHLDGSHLHPSYVPLLQAALDCSVLA